MSIDVICAGFGRTGTLSVKAALGKLGYDNCYHMMELFQHPGHANTWTDMINGQPADWPALFEGYRSITDWPATYFWRELADYYPEAKILLTLRDPEKWWQSISSTIFTAISGAFPDGATEPQLPPDTPQEVIEQIICARASISAGTFNNNTADRDYCISVYEQHNDAVRKYIAADRLLEFEVKQGWQPLCDFLGQPLPEGEFPRLNSSSEFGSNFT
ncbi:MAG: hypothetical protein JKY89_08385 [Immundisolibacteraceae bacterium]|nr:hypothetical protein [Immundisolibacteraceae bacterium]